MKTTILPKTKYGRQSCVLLLIAFIALIFVGIKALMGLPFPEVIILLHVMIIGTLALFSASLTAGIKAIRKAEERSILVFSAILMDLLFVIMLILIFLGVLVSPWLSIYDNFPVYSILIS